MIIESPQTLIVGPGSSCDSSVFRQQLQQLKLFEAQEKANAAAAAELKQAIVHNPDFRVTAVGISQPNFHDKFSHFADQSQPQVHAETMKA